MILTELQRIEFEKASRPLMKFLAENCHPHTKVIVDCTKTEVVEGICTFQSKDYLKD